MILSRDELLRIRAENAPRVRVRCDEYHAHSVECLEAVDPERDRDAVLIERLVVHALEVTAEVAKLGDLASKGRP